MLLVGIIFYFWFLSPISTRLRKGGTWITLGLSVRPYGLNNLESFCSILMYCLLWNHFFFFHVFFIILRLIVLRWITKEFDIRTCQMFRPRQIHGRNSMTNVSISRDFITFWSFWLRHFDNPSEFKMCNILAFINYDIHVGGAPNKRLGVPMLVQILFQKSSRCFNTNVWFFRTFWSLS